MATGWIQTGARLFAVAAVLSAAWLVQGAEEPRHMIVLDPEHSHAAAVFAQPIPGVSNVVHVYAPPGQGVTAFLDSLARFNHRSANPTAWQIESHISPDFLKAMLLEPPGNIVVITGRNDLKIQYLLSSFRAGQNVLADKPWIIDRKDLSLLETALNLAKQKHLAFYDGMTERFNVVYRIQRELLRDPDVFGQPLTGTVTQPAVELENLHSLVKFSNGKVNLRPPWFLDIRKQGEGIADVGTHLVDLGMWSLFPGQAIDYRRDVKVLKATRSPIFLTLPQFERLTGDKEWPSYLQESVHDNQLRYFCNNTASYTIRGIYAAISDRWEYESPGALSDSYLVLYRGTRAAVRVRQSRLENYVPEIDLIPNTGEGTASFTAALERKLKSLSGSYPDLGFNDNGGSIRIVIPHEDRVRGGSTFGQLVEQFLKYVRDPQSLPDWEQPDLLAKYYITTTAVELADR
jgi:predicted dehydrogenase